MSLATRTRWECRALWYVPRLAQLLLERQLRSVDQNRIREVRERLAARFENVGGRPVGLPLTAHETLGHSLGLFDDLGHRGARRPRREDPFRLAFRQLVDRRRDIRRLHDIADQYVHERSAVEDDLHRVAALRRRHACDERMRLEILHQARKSRQQVRVPARAARIRRTSSEDGRDPLARAAPGPCQADNIRGDDGIDGERPDAFGMVAESNVSARSVP